MTNNFGPSNFENNSGYGTPAKKATIKVIGVGGGGGNAINRMITQGLGGVDFYAMNTDAQVLSTSAAQNRLQLGEKLTGGLGAGGNPLVGEKAADESVEQITEALDTLEDVFSSFPDGFFRQLRFHTNHWCFVAQTVAKFF